MPIAFPEIPVLERRVLARERMLQDPIADLAWSKPRFVGHLRERFLGPMSMTQREYDHREADDCATEFMRALMVIREARLPEVKEPRMTDKKVVLPKSAGAQNPATNRPTQRGGVQVHERNGIWQVRVDGKFRGDYHQKDHALAAAALHKLSER